MLRGQHICLQGDVARQDDCGECGKPGIQPDLATLCRAPCKEMSLKTIKARLGRRSLLVLNNSQGMGVSSCADLFNEAGSRKLIHVPSEKLAGAFGMLRKCSVSLQ